jgi:hypothetical protein
MGYVYKAWHPGFNDYVALKTIQDTRLENKQLLARFRREGQALAKLKHQNIVQIYDADQAEGIHFIVMEYMNGGSLDRIIETRDRSPLAKRVGYIVPACHALSYAHRRGLFHRDIKPANIMLHNDGNDEVVKVVDFGIARLVDPTEGQDFSMSQTSMLIGAPSYMAPELLTGTDRANERTDIWALGVTLYELISFERPFHGNNLDELRQNAIHAKAQSLCQFVPECPRELDDIVQRMIHKDPSQRYATVEDLLADLEPLAKRLRLEIAITLVRRADELFEIGEMENAKSVLTEARRYDPTSTQLRELLQKVDRELKRRELLPRLHALLKRARDFAQLEKYQNAREEMASALSLDPDFEPAKKYLAELEEEAKKKEFLQEKLRLTKQRMTEGELTQAEALLKEVEELDRGNSQFLQLRRAIDQERQRRLRRKRLNDIVSRARTLLVELQYDECLELLSRGLQEFPAEAELRRLQDIAREDAAEASRQQERKREIEELKRMIGNGDFVSAQENAQQLLRRFPGDVVIENLRVFAKEGIEKDRRQRNLHAGIEAVRSLLSRGQAISAEAALQKLRIEYHEESELHDLQDSVELELEKERRRKATEEEQRRSVFELEDALKHGRLDEASILVVQLESSGIQQARLSALKTRLAETKEKERRQRQLEGECSRLESLLQSGALLEALSAGQELLDKWPENARIAGMVQQAKEEIETRERNEAIDEETRSVRKKLRVKKYADALTAAEKLLLRFPAEPRVREVHEEATQVLQERKKQEIIQQETREIRQKINKGQYEEAVGEATAILKQLGPQEQIETLLKAAEVELKDQRVREETEERRLSDTRMLLANGDKEKALALMEDAIEASVFKKTDPRVLALMAEIQNWTSPNTESVETPGVDKTVIPPEPSESVLRDRSTYQNERATEVESDEDCAAPGAATDRPPTSATAPNEYRIELLENESGEHGGGRSLQETAVRPGIDFSKLTGIVERLRTTNRVMLVAGIAVGVVLILLMIWGIRIVAAKRDDAAFQRATQEERSKKWSAALGEYKALSAGHGALAERAGKEYARLISLLATEKNLKGQIDEARKNRDYEQARDLLKQLASLHGDMEDEALKESDEVAREAQAAQEAQEIQKAQAAQQKVESRGETTKSAQRNPRTPAEKHSGCELSASDVLIRVKRADKNRANGDYESAEREYLAVLACQPNNEQARAGLERTRNAKNM